MQMVLPVKTNKHEVYASCRVVRKIDEVDVTEKKRKIPATRLPAPAGMAAAGVLNHGSTESRRLRLRS